MYEPKPFAEERPEVILGLLRAAGYGHLVAAGGDGAPASTPLPFIVDDAVSVVRAHLARPNPVWRLAPAPALLIVPVTDAYVSPSWYPSKAEHERVVPTWNYEVVHVHGELRAHDDAGWVAAQVRELTDHNESPLPAPWSVDDPPDGFVDQMVRGIVGVELLVSRVIAKRKLSQNRDEPDRLGARDGLRSTGTARSSAIADAMD